MFHPISDVDHAWVVVMSWAWRTAYTPVGAARSKIHLEASYRCTKNGNLWPPCSMDNGEFYMLVFSYIDNDNHSGTDREWSCVPNPPEIIGCITWKLSAFLYCNSGKSATVKLSHVNNQSTLYASEFNYLIKIWTELNLKSRSMTTGKERNDRVRKRIMLTRIVRTKGL